MKNFIELSLTHTQNDALEYFKNKLTPYAHSSIDRGLYEREVSSNDWGIDLFYLKILQHSEVSPDQRSVNNVPQLLEIYSKQVPSSKIQWDELVMDQWIRVVWDRWYLPHEARIGNIQIESHLKGFFEFLNSIPYPDERFILIKQFQHILETHKIQYPNTPELAELLKKEIIIQEEKQYTLNLSHILYSANANKVLARLWSEGHCGPSNPLERLTWWINYFELSREASIHFLDYLNKQELNSFIKAIMERITSEKDIIGWKEESIKRELEKQPFYKPETVYDPSNKLFPDRLSWVLDDINEHTIHVNDARDRIAWLLGFLIRSELKSGFDSLTPSLLLDQLLFAAEQRPYFYHIIYYTVTEYHPEWIPLMLSSSKHLDWGLILLASFTPNLNLLEKIEEETLKKEWWNIGLIFFGHTFKQLDSKEASLKLWNVTKWLFQSKKEAQSFRGQNEIEVRLANYRYSSFLKLIEELTDENDQDQILPNILPVLSPMIYGDLENSKLPLYSCEYYVMLWIVKNFNKIPIKETEPNIFKDNLNHCVFILQKGYTDSLLSLQPINKIYFEEMSVAWVHFIDYLFQTDKGLFSRFIYCFHHVSRDNKINYIYKLRLHLQLICNLIINWKHTETDECLIDLVNVLEQLLEYQREDTMRGYVDIFSLTHEIFGTSQTQESLYKLIIDVCSHLPENLKERLIIQILKTTNNRGRLSLLIKVLSSNEKVYSQIMAKIESLSDERENLLDAQQTISSFIESQQPTLITKAFELLQKYDELASNKNIRDWINWSFSWRLKGLFFANHFQSILDMQIPNRISHSKSAKLELDFYKGLVFLSKKTSGDVKKAIDIFHNLRKEEPNNISFIINYFTACVTYSTLELDDKITSEKKKELREILNLGEKLFRNFSPNEWSSIKKNYTENQLFLFLLLNDWSNFWSLYWSLEEELRFSLIIGSYAVNAYASQGEEDKAHDLRKILQDKYGEIEGVIELLKVELTPQHFNNFSLAMFHLQNSTPDTQVKLYTLNQDMDLKKFLIGRIADSCRTVCSLLPTLATGVAGALDEDRYTDVFLKIFEEKIRELRWTIKGQDRGGYTASDPKDGHGGVGERDGILYESKGNPLSLIEALVLKHVDTKNIEVHTQKIFGYDTTRVNLHFVINWGISSNPTHTWAGYRKIVSNRTTGKFAVEKTGEITDFSNPDDMKGIKAFYKVHKTSLEEVKAYVIHFYVDVAQEDAKLIAKQARGI
ncbi:hypothetical protein [Bacillus sp. IBL03825]|uniref:hypothetical protein n=1 Tax=Bacillus sp. IBL03825 TaxID=2953580 RepID=UPI002158462B|nr:hypothetical protein [Bacillus sp. IBL03825]MCR6846835.1 hypothetical protein [Bacillus sp. IBL03825]